MKFSTLVLAMAIVLVPPAFAQKVDVDYGHQEDFSKLTSYKWGKNKGQLPDTLEDNHIKNKIDRILQSKGLRRVGSGAADLVVTYQATLMTQQEVDTYQDDPELGLGYGSGWGMGWGRGWGDDADDSTNQVVNIRRGDLLVDIANPATKRIIFRGYSSGAFHSDPLKEDKLLGDTLAKMFKNFPPKVNGKRT
jgi:uncharacterized protein DUF4136